MPLFRRRTSSKPAAVAAPSTADFDFTHVLQIFPRKSNEGIRVVDLTDSITAPYPSDTFNEQAVKLARERTDGAPTWIIRAPQRGQGRLLTLHEGHMPPSAASPAMASWDPSLWENGSNDFAFPADSPHCSHDFSMTRPGFLRQEAFVKDSVRHIWKCDSISRRSITLYKDIGGRQTVIAKYATPSIFSKTGGTLVADARELDLIVTFMTCAGMILKLRQAN